MRKENLPDQVVDSSSSSSTSREITAVSFAVGKEVSVVARTVCVVVLAIVLLMI